MPLSQILRFEVIIGVVKMPAAKPEKTEYLKARVDQYIKEDFEEICKQLEIKPAEQLREMVIDFLDRQKKLLSESVQIQITRPDGFDFGAWQVKIKIRDSIKNLAAPFKLPKLAHRTIHSEPEYQSAWLDDKKQIYEMGGLLIDRQWRGNMYTNGISENDNPTSVDMVRAALKEEIERVLSSPIFNA
ncbi:hypothetical protein BTW15_27765 [Pseudomonas syringae pv. tomato]|nr:hypothetical protein BTW15_27765 [Pseudomonas syringae pv. tomato]